MDSRLKILYLAAEAEPFVKVGGLGDVAGSLPLALLSYPDIDIRLVLPLYPEVRHRSFPLAEVVDFDIPYRSERIPTQVFSTNHKELLVYLVSGDPFEDSKIYSPNASKDAQKFTYFSLAALELCRLLEWKPEIIHANDWHTAPAIYALFTQPDSFFQATVKIMGLHNLPYLGLGGGPAMNAFGLKSARRSSLPEWAQNVPLPLGLLAADHIVTVSPTYAREILTQDFGVGLDGYLSTRADEITGILNGLDTSLWNPESDPLIHTNYNSKSLAQRAHNKNALLAELNLNVDPKIPLIGVVSRLDTQKGIDLIPDALRQIRDTPWQFISLASGDSKLTDVLQGLQVSQPQRVRTMNRYDAGLSHRIYSAADILLIPSRYEPCGLTQMIAMRYGCVPIARATGGLQDTISDFNLSNNGTGFLFKQADPQSLSTAVRRALEVFASKEHWSGLQKRGMQRDFSWSNSASKHKELYERLAREKRKGSTL